MKICLVISLLVILCTTTYASSKFEQLTCFRCEMRYNSDCMFHPDFGLRTDTDSQTEPCKYCYKIKIGMHYDRGCIGEGLAKRMYNVSTDGCQTHYMDGKRGVFCACSDSHECNRSNTVILSITTFIISTFVSIAYYLS